MNLYLLTLKVGHDYDCAYGFVVRALSAEEARIIASTEAGNEKPESWLNEAKSSCRKLERDGKTGIILRDYNAG